ncbi:hypothetical protein [Flavobacterium sp. JP2137]|uniref:hypothetical protein n=1 Tax=Flavobacterium sp. JP2137 TaxID=3414510 RepID=UPI003D2FC76E
MTTLSKTAVFQYQTVNYTLLLILLIGAVFALYSPLTPSCYYSDLGITCPSCGLTRDFKSILQGAKAPFINPASPYYFAAFSCLILSRVTAIIRLKYRRKTNGLIRFEGVVVGLIALCLLLARL